MVTRFTGIPLTLVLAAILTATGCAGGSSTAKPTAVVSVTAEQLFAKMSTLPRSGPGSVAAVYTRLGGMTFGQYYDYLYKMAPTNAVAIDGFVITDAKSQLADSRLAFLAMGGPFAQVKDWWQATGFKAAAFTDQSGLKQALGSAFGSVSSGLGLAGASSDGASSSASQLGLSGAALGGDAGGSLTSATCESFNGLWDNAWFGTSNSGSVSGSSGSKKSTLTPEQIAHLDQQQLTVPLANGENPSLTTPQPRLVRTGSETPWDDFHPAPGGVKRRCPPVFCHPISDLTSDTESSCDLDASDSEWEGSDAGQPSA